ncbi:MAG TPA: type IV pilus twitching motility protein PilT [Desulfobacteria bacterium]|nr:type IV pilus twitching motility protein PilT [Desulfobacteria bacterium]
MDINELLKTAIEQNASDLHLTVNVPPIIRVNGHLQQISETVLTREFVADLAEQILGEKQKEVFERRGEVDFSHSVAGFGRFRVNVFRQRGTPALSIRIIPPKVLTPEELGLPDTVKSLARKPNGLVLVTGPTGSGKSTTLAALIDLLNREISGHIITLEDPIEFLHTHKKCIVNQREIGLDSDNFPNALRAALRQDPDVILVGEMRDLETIATAITAAETGHLVFATLHTSSAAQTIDRIIDVFPPHQQNQVRVQLSLILQGIVAQTLLPRADGPGRVVATEMMAATPAIRNLIREGKTPQINTVIQSGAKYGMQTMDSSLKELYQQGIISYEEACKRVTDLENFNRMVQGF